MNALTVVEIDATTQWCLVLQFVVVVVCFQGSAAHWTSDDDVLGMGPLLVEHPNILWFSFPSNFSSSITKLSEQKAHMEHILNFQF